MKNNLLCGITVSMMLGTALNGNSRDIVTAGSGEFHMSVYNTCRETTGELGLPIWQKPAPIPKSKVLTTKPIASASVTAPTPLPAPAPESESRGVVATVSRDFHLSVYNTCRETTGELGLPIWKKPEQQQQQKLTATKPTASHILPGIVVASAKRTHDYYKPQTLVPGRNVAPGITSVRSPQKQRLVGQTRRTRTYSIIGNSFNISEKINESGKFGTTRSFAKCADHANDLVYAIGRLKALAGANYTRALFRIASIPRVPVFETKINTNSFVAPSLIYAKAENDNIATGTAKAYNVIASIAIGYKMPVSSHADANKLLAVNTPPNEGDQSGSTDNSMPVIDLAVNVPNIKGINESPFSGKWWISSTNANENTEIRVSITSPNEHQIYPQLKVIAHLTAARYGTAPYEAIGRLPINVQSNNLLFISKANKSEISSTALDFAVLSFAGWMGPPGS